MSTRDQRPRGTVVVMTPLDADDKRIGIFATSREHVEDYHESDMAIMSPEFALKLASDLIGIVEQLRKGVPREA